MVLVSGPTGSGKTTTLYASVLELVRDRGNIMTVEDPVEYRVEGLNQIEVNRAAGIDFPAGLRAIVRLDPDVILVGEIRDCETAKTAVDAASPATSCWPPFTATTPQALLCASA